MRGPWLDEHYEVHLCLRMPLKPGKSLAYCVIPTSASVALMYSSPPPPLLLVVQTVRQCLKASLYLVTQQFCSASDGSTSNCKLLNACERTKLASHASVELLTRPCEFCPVQVSLPASSVEGRRINWVPCNPFDSPGSPAGSTLPLQHRLQTLDHKA